MLAQILYIDYFLNNNKPIIRIFAKTEKNKTVCLLDSNFLPYFYVEKKPENINKANNLKLEYKIVKKFKPRGYQKEPTEFMKIFLNDPSAVSTLREEFSHNDCYDADVMFKYRYMIDHGIKGMGWVDAKTRPIKTRTTKLPTFDIKEIKPLEKTENSKLKFMALDIECLQYNFNRPLDAKKDPIIMVSLAFSPAYRGNDKMVLVGKRYNDQNAKGFSDEKVRLQTNREKMAGLVGKRAPLSNRSSRGRPEVLLPGDVYLSIR